jgi:phosphoribosylformimino-5-aminoimidazole carboxamide ribotide isomerase
MLTGPNLAAIKNMVIKTGLKITASGGVSSMKDIDALKLLELFGVDSVIVGKALYEKKVDLENLF